MPRAAARKPDRLLDDRVLLKLAGDLRHGSICCKGYKEKLLKFGKSSASWTAVVLDWFATEKEICSATVSRNTGKSTFLYERIRLWDPGGSQGLCLYMLKTPRIIP